jgi:ankyrin repeat protein
MTLNKASEVGNVEEVKRLLSKRVKALTLDKSLMLACWYGHLEVVKLLVANGANIHANQNESLKMACYYGRLEIIKLLLERGASIDGNEGDNAVSCACYYGHLETVKLLVAHGASEYFESARKWAEFRGHKEIANYLIKQMLLEKINELR